MNKNKLFLIFIILYWINIYLFKAFDNSEWTTIEINKIEYIARPIGSKTEKWDIFYYFNERFCLLILFLMLANISKDSKVKKFSFISFILISMLLLYQSLKFSGLDFQKLNESELWNKSFGILILPFLYILYKNE